MSDGPSPLRNPLFRALWLGSIVSNIGTTMNDTAAVWTMTTLTGSATMVSLMQAMSSLPLFLFALPAGAMADLVNRRRLILFAQTGALLTALGMAVLVWLGMLNQSLLLLATFQLGVAAAFTTPAWQALIPEVVGRQQLGPAIALSGVGYNIARSLGPIAGGLLLASLGPAPVFAINALSFVAVIIVMSTGTYVATPRSAQREQMLGAMAAAIRYVRHASAMRSVLARGGVHIFAAVAPVVLLPIIVHSRNWNASDFGIMMGCYGVGAICTALLVLPKLRARFSFDQVLLGASLVSAAATALVAIVPGRIPLGMVLLVAGGAWLAGLNTFSVASQSVFPNWVRARSSAIYLVVMQGSSALGAIVWGQVTSHFNAPVALTVAAVGLVFSAILSRLLPISHVENLDLSPSNHWHGHALANEPAPDDGPILITIEYHIDPAEAVAFRAAMFHLRETRLRDGAFRCSVFVDLNDATLYRETFLVGSWAEHLRQHDRATVEDQRVELAVQAFHRLPEPPVVRHLLMTNLREKRV
ncbi:MAG: MFS transporter [Luteolibacter sp.]|uniref:MFS transporter n=1 Tax=Luteolibacter sp. TaxID=1962973 RepID=UPI0032653CC2